MCTGRLIKALFVPAKKNMDCPNCTGKISVITHPFDRLWCCILNDFKKNDGMENAAGIKFHYKRLQNY